MTQSSTNQTARPESVALFVSDLHLQAEMPVTTRAFLSLLQHAVRHTGQLYLLGDIFEYWAGDDDLDTPFLRQIVAALRAVSDAGIALFWMAGNRDFLVGTGFAKATGATLLSDPHYLEYGGRRYLLTHGDQLCTDDLKYLEFRHMVRNPTWQQAFLARPLAERKAIIAGMRQQSRLHQQTQTAMIMDVNQDAVDRLFKDHHAHILIHGHTHRPARHQVHGTQRYVLSDWNCDHATPRGDYLVLLPDGRLQRYDLQGNTIQD